MNIRCGGFGNQDKTGEQRKRALKLIVSVWRVVHNQECTVTTVFRYCLPLIVINTVGVQDLRRSSPWTECCSSLNHFRKSVFDVPGIVAVEL